MECRRCRRDVAPEDSSANDIAYCEACAAALERLAAAVNHAAPDDFRGVIPLLTENAHNIGPALLLSIEAWAHRFDLRLFEPLPVPPNVPPSMRLPYIATTDVGTTHDGFGSGGHGGGDGWTITVQFHPPLPEGAGTIQLQHGVGTTSSAVGPIPLAGWPVTLVEAVPATAASNTSRSEGGCRRCGAVVGKHAPFCTRCRDTVDATVRAYSETPNAPRYVRPINVRLGSIFGATATLFSIDEADQWFNLRYHLAPWVPRATRPFDPPVHGRYEAEDDLGNAYRGFGNSGEGRRDEWTGDVAFSPALAKDASVLTLVLKGPDEADLLRVTVPISRT